MRRQAASRGDIDNQLRPKLVASRTWSEAVWHNTEVTANIVAELTRRKQLDDKTIYVFGSAELTDTLFDAGPSTNSS